jgi:hypothetical protein
MRNGMHPPSHRLLVAVALALGLITVACGQEHRLPAGTTIPGSPSPAVQRFPSTELPASACVFPDAPAGSGLNGIYRGHSPFALALSLDGEAHTVCLKIARQGESVGGDWYLQGACCEGGVVNAMLDDTAGSATLGRLKLRLPSVDYDLGLDAAVISADASSFSGELGMCQSKDCSDRGPTGPVTFTRQ